MIKSLTVTNHLGEALKIVLGESDRSGFLITRIEGLGPCKATINSTEMATGDGSIFNSSRLEARNIVISIVFDYRFGQDIEDLRHKSYKYFPIKKKVKILVETGRRLCEIEGYVESNEPMLFSPREGTQISIMCPDPYFYSAGDAGTQVTTFENSDPAFEFAFDDELGYGVFSNESLESPMIEIGRIADNDYQNVPYYGDADIGMEIVLTIESPTGNIKIFDAETNSEMILDAAKISKITGAPPSAGDVITISTVRGNRHIKLFRSGKEHNILNSIARNSTWFVLNRGDNMFSYSIDSGSIRLVIRNKVLYEGV